jgi:hemolysin-activating ACP:hemolysin acyltransferase
MKTNIIYNDDCIKILNSKIDEKFNLMRSLAFSVWAKVDDKALNKLLYEVCNTPKKPHHSKV